MTTRDDLLRARTLKTLGHAALQLGLAEALGASMLAILGASPRGRLKRELLAIGQTAGGEDLATLLAYGDELLVARNKRPLKDKLLTLSRSYLVAALEGRKGEAASPSRPANDKALRAWAEAHDITPLLDASVYRELHERHPAVFSGTVDATVERGSFALLLGDPTLEDRTSISSSRLERLRDAAWQHMQEVAGEARQAREARDPRLTRPPADEDRSTKAQLIRRALEAWAGLESRVVPRLPSRIQAEPVVVEDGTPPVFVHTEAPADRYAFPTRVRIPLLTDAPWQITCTAHKDPCPHQLTGVERLLEILQSGEDAEIAAIVDPVGLEPWTRALKAVDAILGPAPQTEGDAVDAIVTWGVTVAGRRPQVQPWLHTGKGASKGRRVRPDKLLESALSPEDRHIAELLELHQLMPDPRSARAERVLQRLLTRLVGHPNVRRQPEGDPLDVQRVQLRLVTVRGEGSVRLMPSIEDRILSFEDLEPPSQIRVGRFVVIDDSPGRLILVDVPETAQNIVRILRQHDFQIPERALSELIQRLPAFARHLPLVLDRDVPRTTEPAQRHLVLHLSPQGRGLVIRAEVEPLPQGSRYAPGEGPAEIVAVAADGSLRSALRDRGAEAAWARERLRVLLEAELDDQPWRYRLPDGQDALRSLERLEQAADVTAMWAPGQTWTIRARPVGGQGVRLTVRDRPDWFGIQGDADVDGARVPLDRLMDAVRHERTFVEVGDGAWTRIGDDLRARIAALEPHVRYDGQELTVSPAAAESLEALGESGAEFVRSARWKANLERLKAARTADLAVPADFGAELRDYQRAGYQWMTRLATWGLGACLADDMGLGKTVQTLAVLTARANAGPQLVVAPTSLVYNWARETERFAPALRTVMYLGAERQALLDDLGPGDLVITSYGIVVRDEERLTALTFATVVLDEAQAIKNAQSQRSRAVRRLRADWRLALSGTPVENHLGELWALFACVAPGLLGGWDDFRERFVVPIERDGHRARAEALSRLLRPFVLRRTKREVATELPPRTTMDVDVVLTDAERAEYEQARTRAVADLADVGADPQGRMQALAALTRLRQLACHPRLVDPESPLPSSKLARALELMRDVRATGQRALVFSQFTRHLALVRTALDEAQVPYLYLDGQTPPDDRAERVERFQQGEVPLFLISLKAGGTGLNLTAADTVIHLDPWWNPAVEDQATDRAHRIGQTKPVSVYRLIARGTVEEAILRLHADKRALMAQILEGTQEAGRLGTDELIALIGAD